MSLRLKLLLAASLLLTVPVAGYRFVLAMESFLRDSQIEAAAAAARTIASAVQSRPGLGPTLSGNDSAPGPVLFVHPLAAAPEIDGYDADWSELATDPQARGPSLRTGSRDGAFFLLLRVPAREAGEPGSTGVRLVMEDAPGLRRAWHLNTAIPGQVVAFEVPPAPGVLTPGHRDARILAAVGRERGATVLEVRLPLPLLAPALLLEFPSADGRMPTRIPADTPFRLLLPPAGLQPALDALGGRPGRRLRVTDTAGRVLAQAGSLEGAGAPGAFGAFMEQLLDAGEDELLSLVPGTLTLDGPEIRAALDGTPMASLRRGADDLGMVVSATHPLRSADGFTGVLLLEESTSGIQALARRALLELVATAALAFIAGTAVLLLVAGRTAARLAVLRDRARLAVDVDGRVQGAFEAPAGGDEIGDLGRSFESAVSRLAGYQEYLEQLARRLSHELRTPIAVVRSSLENMALSTPGGHDASPSVERARQGVERLDALIRRMSEATRLEQAMTDTERVAVDVAALAASVVEARSASWTSTQLALAHEPDPLWISGSPDLLLQALDKLLSNARDFARPHSVVTLRARRAGAQAELCVENDGPALPDGSPRRLFDSMVSERPEGDHGEPHLGLGLHIVRLVARFHGGSEFAGNVTGPDGRITGVRIGMRLPVTQVVATRSPG